MAADRIEPREPSEGVGVELEDHPEPPELPPSVLRRFETQIRGSELDQVFRAWKTRATKMDRPRFGPHLEACGLVLTFKGREGDDPRSYEAFVREKYGVDVRVELVSSAPGHVDGVMTEAAMTAINARVVDTLRRSTSVSRPASLRTSVRKGDRLSRTPDGQLLELYLRDAYRKSPHHRKVRAALLNADSLTPDQLDSIPAELRSLIEGAPYYHFPLPEPVLEAMVDGAYELQAVTDSGDLAGQWVLAQYPIRLREDVHVWNILIYVDEAGEERLEGTAIGIHPDLRGTNYSFYLVDGPEEIAAGFDKDSVYLGGGCSYFAESPDRARLVKTEAGWTLYVQAAAAYSPSFEELEALEAGARQRQDVNDAVSGVWTFVPKGT